MKTIYSYIDESGQHTHGELFIVAVVIAADDVETLSKKCIQIEQESKKGKSKWHKSRYAYRVTYMEKILEDPYFEGKLHYCAFQEGETNFDGLTIEAISKVLAKNAPKEKHTNIIKIDGEIGRKKIEKYTKTIRRNGVHVKKVKPVRKAEDDPITRLADAIAGFVADALEQTNKDIAELHKQMINNRRIVCVE